MAELSCTGILWLTLSTLAALGASSGFFLPYWIRGSYLPPPSPLTRSRTPAPSPHSPVPTTPTTYPIPVFLGTFRRCNYLRLVTDENRDSGDGRSSSSRDGGGLGSGGGVMVAPPPEVEVVMECGRYTRFTDIPSVWWQIGTVICGTGSALALLVAMTGAWALCVRYVLTKGTARVAAGLQLLAGLLIGGGVALYPLGWGSREVRQVCGPSASVFRLGDCELYWAFYLTASAGGLTLLCSILAICAPSSKADYS